MCGRFSQYQDIDDYVAALDMPNDLFNTVGDQALERYNVAPTSHVALLHLEGNILHANPLCRAWPVSDRRT